MVTPDAISGLRALADATRLQVARLLVEGAFNVGEIQEVLNLGQSTVSHHLKVLAEAGLLDCRREGRLAWYGWQPALSAPQEALRAFVQAHAAGLDADARRRLHRIFESRAERTRSFFAGPAAAALVSGRGSEKGGSLAVDVVAAMMSELPRCAVAVDLGTGSGRLLGPLRDRAKRVIGIDASPVMLGSAGRLASERGWKDVELRLGTLEHLPLADGEADAAVAHQVLHHAARPEIALAEAFRALRAGGILVVGDYLPHDREWMREELADQWLGFDPKAFARLLEAAGFTEVVVSEHAGSGDALGMFVAAGRRGPGGPALVSREKKDGPGPRRAGRTSMRPASPGTRRRRTSARGEES